MLIIIFMIVVVGFIFWRYYRQSELRFNFVKKNSDEKNTQAKACAYEPAPKEFLTEDEEVQAARSMKQIKSIHRAYSNVRENDLIVLNIMPDEKKFYQGYELIQALLSEGLRFGAMKIFHRHENKKGEGPVLVSMTSIAKPGTFDLEQIGALRCPGLCCFFSVQQVSDPIEVFELMLETANNLAEELGGQVCNAKRKPISDDELLGLRLKVRRLQESRHTPDLFEEDKNS